MYGLAVRWSLHHAPSDAAQQLRTYVCDTSIDRFSGMPGLCFKTWRMVPGEWFEGVYVWQTAQARQEFLTTFRAGADTAPGSQLSGSPPVAYEEFEVVAVAEGGAGFHPGPGPGRDGADA